MKRRIFWVTVLYMVVLLLAPPVLSFLAAFVWIGYLTSVVLYALWNAPRGRKAAQHRRHLETSYARHRLSAARRATVLDDKGPEGHD
jgi:hypothetical protein